MMARTRMLFAQRGQMRQAHGEEARVAWSFLSGGALDSQERRGRWGQRFQAVRWPAQGVDRVRDEYTPQRRRRG